MAKTRKLSLGEHRLIGNIIGDSFADDPVNRWVFGQEVAITQYYTQVAKKLYLPQGYGHVMDDGSGGSLWLPPNVKKHIPLLNSVDIAISMLRHNGLKSIIRGMKVDTSLSKHKPVEAHHYLFAIGVRAGNQGKGLGAKLMEAGLKQADKESMPAYLESSKESNIPFYNRFGFEVIERVVPTKDYPPLWLMWRAAR